MEKEDLEKKDISLILPDILDDEGSSGYESSDESDDSTAQTPTNIELDTTSEILFAGYLDKKVPRL